MCDQAGRALYPAAKAAILQLTRNAAMELAPQRIRVNSVSPAWTWSASVARAAGGDRAKADRVGAAYHPLGRIADAEEVAHKSGQRRSVDRRPHRQEQGYLSKWHFRSQRRRSGRLDPQQKDN
jgi:NAD(P)-dependent dehydrogenase (short-subunit alcohol dehydrogenase family)